MTEKSPCVAVFIGVSTEYEKTVALERLYIRYRENFAVVKKDKRQRARNME